MNAQLRLKQTFLLLLMLAFWSIPAAAQRVITADEVNAIAKKLYCPVCENIPLDTCGTAACDDWRYEIRLQLEAGKTEQEIIDDFVRRFGDRVVGTPQDPVLHTISVTLLWIGVGLALLFALYVVFRRSKSKQAPLRKSQPEDKYQSMLEKDLTG
jgi:cytochrome c-type biogenesis protein CcmH